MMIISNNLNFMKYKKSIKFYQDIITRETIWIHPSSKKNKTSNH